MRISTMTIRNMIIDIISHTPGLNNKQVADAIHVLEEGKSYSYESVFRELRRLSSETTPTKKRLRMRNSRYYLEDDANKSSHLENWMK